MIGIYLVHGWMHLFMVHVDYRLFGTGWCMVVLVVEPDYLPDLEVFYFHPCLFPMKYLHPISM
jgi:hypothetical protein